MNPNCNALKALAASCPEGPAMVKKILEQQGKPAKSKKTTKKAEKQPT